MITQAFVVDCRLDLRKSFEFWTIGFEGGCFYTGLIRISL